MGPPPRARRGLAIVAFHSLSPVFQSIRQLSRIILLRKSNSVQYPRNIITFIIIFYSSAGIDRHPLSAVNYSTPALWRPTSMYVTALSKHMYVTTKLYLMVHVRDT